MYNVIYINLKNTQNNRILLKRFYGCILVVVLPPGGYSKMSRGTLGRVWGAGWWSCCVEWAGKPLGTQQGAGQNRLAQNNQCLG